MFKIIRRILIIVLLCVFAVSAFYFGKTIYGYKTADKTYASLQNRFVTHVERDLPDATPEYKTQAPIHVDFAALKQECPDIVGWLYCPDTVINYPVVQGKDNDQYLRSGLNGKYLASGTLFVDCHNGQIGSDANYLIYGHNMKNGTMFAPLTKYKDQAYYDAHPTLYFLTEEGNYQILLFSGAVANEDSGIYSTAPDISVIEQLFANSTFRSPVTPDNSDTIITLSTCSYEYNNARYIVLGKLVKI